MWIMSSNISVSYPQAGWGFILFWLPLFSRILWLGSYYDPLTRLVACIILNIGPVDDPDCDLLYPVCLSVLMNDEMASRLILMWVLHTRKLWYMLNAYPNAGSHNKLLFLSDFFSLRFGHWSLFERYIWWQVSEGFFLKSIHFYLSTISIPSLLAVCWFLPCPDILSLLNVIMDDHVSLSSCLDSVALWKLKRQGC